MSATLTAAESLAAMQSDLLSIECLHYMQSRTKARLGGSTRKRMREWLIESQGLTCVICGLLADDTIRYGMPEYAEMGHLISAEYIATATGTDITNTDNKGGYVIGNLAIQHHKCNARMGTSIITADMLARPDLVPLHGPRSFHKNGPVWD